MFYYGQKGEPQIDGVWLGLMSLWSEICVRYPTLGDPAGWSVATCQDLSN